MAEAARAALMRWRDTLHTLAEEPEVRTALLELADLLDLIVTTQEQHAHGFRRLG